MATSNILMIRPVAFEYNAQTAVNNSFQKTSEQVDIQQIALQEFDAFVDILKQKGIGVLTIQDTLEPHTPDSIFPNNWVSFHDDGAVVLYPMFAENRRLERDKLVLEKIDETFWVNTKIDLTAYEKNNCYLEGTGSMVLDRDNKIAYACISPRTDATVLYDFADSLGYTPVLFNAVDSAGKDIYHTNVLMCVADEYIVICLESIKDAFQRQMLVSKFSETEKEVIEISYEQMNNFAGNMLQVENYEGNRFVVMSTRAFNSLKKDQISRLQTFNPIIHASLNTIEDNGGGSARCMMAEIYLPRKGEINDGNKSG